MRLIGDLASALRVNSSGLIALLVGSLTVIGGAGAFPVVLAAPSATTAAAASTGEEGAGGDPESPPAAAATPTPEAPRELTSGTFIVKSDLEYGECYLDGRLVTRLPMPGPWTAPVGQYTIELREGDWRTSRPLEIRAGELTEVTLRRASLEGADAAAGPERPKVIQYAPPPFPLYETSYGLLGLSALTLGLAAYFQLDAMTLAEEARSLGRDQLRSEQDRLVNEAEERLSQARLSYGLSVTTLIGGLSYLLFSGDGLLNGERGAPAGLFEQRGE